MYIDRKGRRVRKAKAMATTQQQPLPGKSYADAVEEGPSDGVQGNGSAPEANGANANGNGHTASVLRIVDTGADGKKEGKKDKKETKKTNKDGDEDKANDTDGLNKENQRPPLTERQESKHEYSATVCIPSWHGCIVFRALEILGRKMD